MGKLKKTLLLGFGLMCCSSTTLADEPTAVENYLMSKGTTIVAKFDSQAQGIKGIVARTAGGEQQLFYLIGDSYLVAGQVFDASGANLTEIDMARVSTLPDENTPSQASLNEAYTQAQELEYIQDGTGGRVVYALFDPECPYCHEFYKNSRKAVEQGLIQIRWLPVALLGNNSQRQTSKRKIQTLYTANNSHNAMMAMSTGQLQESDLTDNVNVALSRNLLFMRDLPSRRVPTVLFKDHSGKAVLYDGLNNQRYQHMITP